MRIHGGERPRNPLVEAPGTIVRRFAPAEMRPANLRPNRDGPASSFGLCARLSHALHSTQCKRRRPQAALTTSSLHLPPTFLPAGPAVRARRQRYTDACSKGALSCDPDWSWVSDSPNPCRHRPHGRNREGCPHRLPSHRRHHNQAWQASTQSARPWRSRALLTPRSKCQRSHSGPF